MAKNIFFREIEVVFSINFNCIGLAEGHSALALVLAQGNQFSDFHLAKMPSNAKIAKLSSDVFSLTFKNLE